MKYIFITCSLFLISLNLFGSSLDFSIKALRTADPTKTLSLSPYALNITLQSLETGSEGITKRELYRLLGKNSNYSTQLEREAILAIPKSKNSAIKIENILFYPPCNTIKESYTEGIKKRLGIMSLSFDSDQFKQLRNNAESPVVTNGLYLSSKCHISTELLRPFPTELTFRGPFHSDTGSVSRSLLYLRDKRTAGYFEDTLCITTELKLHSNFSLFIVLPKNKSIKDFIQTKLNTTYLTSLFASCVESEVDITFPKMTIDSSASVTSHLISLGLKKLFFNFANFCHITPDSVSIKDILHVSNFSINEIGVHCEEASKKVKHPISLKTIQHAIMYNRPFVFFLVHKPSSTCMQTGLYFGDLKK